MTVTNPRTILDPGLIAPAAAKKLEEFHADVVLEVASAIKQHPVVVVGMAQNPHVGAVKSALGDAGIEFHYLAYGSYFSAWKERLAIKMWSGWPTFPQVFVNGVLLGGEALTKAALADGSLLAQLKPNKVAATPRATEAVAS